MPTPSTRRELLDSTQTSYRKLVDELDATGPRAGRLLCVDDWTVKDLLAVRAWWTDSVMDWVAAGQRGDRPIVPAPGCRWTETPRLNATIVRISKRESYRSVRKRLQTGYERISPTVESLNDRQLLKTGVYPWAGRFPVSRWIAINTTRQYQTARTFVRRVIRNSEQDDRVSGS